VILNKWKILLIDDEQLAHDVAKLALKDYPIELVKAQSIVEGIECLLKETEGDGTPKYRDEKKQFDLVIVDMQLPPQKIIKPLSMSFAGSLLEDFRVEIAAEMSGEPQFTDLTTSKKHPTGGFWLLACAVEKLGMPVERFALYTVREKDTFMPLFGSSKLGIIIYPRQDKRDQSVFEKIAREHLERIALDWLKTRLSPLAIEKLADNYDEKKWEDLLNIVLIDDVICGQRRKLKLSEAFCFCHRELDHEEEFAMFIMKKLFEPVTKFLPVLYKDLLALCHGLEEIITESESLNNIPNNPILKNRMVNFFSLWAYHKKSFPEELLTYPRKLVNNIFDSRLEQDLLNGTNKRWYHSLIELYMHYLYMRFPTIMLLDWCEEKANWSIKADASNNLLNDAPGFNESVHSCLLNFERRKEVANYIARHKEWASNSNLLSHEGEHPKFYIDLDFFTFVFQAIAENRERDGDKGFCRIAFIREDAHLQIVILHVKKEKDLQDKDRRNLYQKVDSFAKTKVGLRGLRLKIRRMGGQACIWYKQNGQWKPLGESDKIIEKKRFVEIYQPLQDEYLCYIFRFKEE